MNKQRAAFAAAIILAWMPFAINGAYSAMWQWSNVASSNSSADPTINWREGQAPSSVNDSARALMARVAEWRDDESGALVTSGTSTAYLVTTNQVLPSPPTQNQMLAFVPHTTNGIAPTLSADGGTAFPIWSAQSTAVAAGTLSGGTPYRVTFRGSAWYLQDVYGSAFGVPLGAFLHSTLPNPPNANFVVPNGQCLSTTTYATYWAAIGSPSNGTCPGGNFHVAFVNGRTLTALDNLGGVTANVLTSSSSGCGTSFTSLGANCANGTEGWTLTTAQLPATSAPVTGQVATFATNFTLSSNYASTGPLNAVTNISGGGTGVVSGNVSFSNGGAASFGSNGAHPNVSPNIGVYVYLRVL